MQGTLPQNQSPPWAQESDYRCMPDASDRYLERPVQAGALFRKGLSCRQADGAFRCYFQGGGPGSTSQAGLYFQGRTGRRVRLRPSSISFFPAVPAAVFLRPFSFCFGYRFVSNFVSSLKYKYSSFSATYVSFIPVTVILHRFCTDSSHPNACLPARFCAYLSMFFSSFSWVDFSAKILYFKVAIIHHFCCNPRLGCVT